MEDRKSSGILGLLGAVGCMVLFWFLKGVFPRLATLLLIIGAIILVLIVLLVVFVMCLAFSKPKGEEKKSATGDISTVIAKGRAGLLESRRTAMKIKNQQVRTIAEEICRQAEKILNTLREQPENISQVRQFLNYYLPTFGSILLKFTRMEESSTLTPELLKSTIACLGDIRTAMEKQYRNLFEDDELDLMVEMEALTIACKRDGLLADENIPFG